MTIKDQLLSSSGMSPVLELGRLERDNAVKSDAIKHVRNNDVDTASIIEELAKTDSVINHVWNHYSVNKQKDPISTNDIKYFWEKVAESCSNVLEDKK